MVERRHHERSATTLTFASGTIPVHAGAGSEDSSRHILRSCARIVPSLRDVQHRNIKSPSCATDLHPRAVRLLYAPGVSSMVLTASTGLRNSGCLLDCRLRHLASLAIASVVQFLKQLGRQAQRVQDSEHRRQLQHQVHHQVRWTFHEPCYGWVPDTECRQLPNASHVSVHAPLPLHIVGSGDLGVYPI